MNLIFSLLASISLPNQFYIHPNDPVYSIKQENTEIASFVKISERNLLCSDQGVEASAAPRVESDKVIFDLIDERGTPLGTIIKFKEMMGVKVFSLYSPDKQLIAIATLINDTILQISDASHQILISGLLDFWSLLHDHYFEIQERPLLEPIDPRLLLFLCALITA